MSLTPTEQATIDQLFNDAYNIILNGDNRVVNEIGDKSLKTMRNLRDYGTEVARVTKIYIGAPDDEEVVFNTKHTIDRLDYDDMGHFVTDTDYKPMDQAEETAEVKRASVWMVEDEITAVETSDTKDSVEPEPEKQTAKSAEPMEVNFALVNSTPLPVEQLRARLSLARLVPGLKGSAVMMVPAL